MSSKPLFDKENIKPITPTNVIVKGYVYELPNNKRISLVVSKNDTPEGLELIVTIDEPDKSDAKIFPANNYGFEEATDYFESIISKEIEPDKPKNKLPPAPPVGILTVTESDVFLIVSMQDGRKANYKLSDVPEMVKIKDSDLQVKFKKSDEFEEYFMAVTKKENVFTLYPKKDIIIVNEPPTDDEPPNHEPPPPPKIDKDTLAREMGYRDYINIVSFAGGFMEILNDYTIEERAVLSFKFNLSPAELMIFAQDIDNKNT